MRRAPLWLPLCLLLAGCGAEEYREDAAFIRELPEPAPPTMERDESLFPMQVGQRWEWDVYVGRNASGTDEAAAKIPPYTEVTQMKPSDRAGEVLMETTQAGRIVRRERMILRNRSLLIRTMGGVKELFLSPPMPVLKFPVTAGAYYNWQGRLGSAKNMVSATAISRVTSREEGEVLGRTTPMYRVDTVVTAVAANGQRVDIPMVRWYSPGVGMVKQKIVQVQQDAATKKSVNMPLLKIVQRYRPAPMP